MKISQFPLSGRRSFSIAPLFWLVLAILLPWTCPGTTDISGELRRWHTVTVTFEGPECSETGSPNPFLDYRLNVTFRQGNREWIVPGYYAGDGMAGHTKASSGNKWRVHFAPDQAGTWEFMASFRKGASVAASTDPDAGVAVSFNGTGGRFLVGESDKAAPDFRGKGWRRYVGKPYPRFDNGEYFIRSGPGGPENFLGYSGFDNTPDHGYRHDYLPHQADHDPADDSFLWNGKGKGILGLINYISGQGMNSMYLIAATAGGDTQDTFPWIGPTDYTRYDLSKLDQWEIVFSYMTQKGIELHFFFNEEENDLLIDGGDLGTARKVYYREMIARFGHHLAVTWNLGEEINTVGDGRPTNSQIASYCSYIRSIDPYDHPIAAHNADSLAALYMPLLGFSYFEAATIQTTTNHADNGLDPLHQQMVDWRRLSAEAGRPWIVTNDEQGGWKDGLPKDANDPWHPEYRHKALWGALMAGGGIAYYWTPDVSTEELHSRQQMWQLSSLAVDFFQKYLPFEDMVNANQLTVSTTDYVLALEGEVYAIYLPSGGRSSLDLSSASDTFSVKWFNPREVNNPTLQLLDGSVTEVTGGSVVSTGDPPVDADSDWVVLIRSTPEKSASKPVWLERDGLLVMEAEKGTPETGDTWELRTDVEDFVGEGFIRWEGPDYLNDKSHGILLYRFVITTPGRYRLFLRSFHDPEPRGKRPDEENDCWTNSVLGSKTQYLKTFRNAVLAGTDWSYRTQWTLGEDHFVDAYYDIPAGEHEFRLAARANYFMIDRIFLARDTSTIDEYAPESPLVGSTTYAMWLKDHFSPGVLDDPQLMATDWGPSADPESDGMVNAMEFYSGGNPWSADAGSLFSPSMENAVPAIRLRRSLRAGGITIIPEVSTNLSSWSARPELAGYAYESGHGWLVVTVPSLSGARFLRLGIEETLD